MRIFFKNYFLLFFLLLIFSCRKKEVHIPDTVLEKKVMVEVLTDMHITEAALIIKNNFGNSNVPLAASYYKFIFEKNKTTPEQFKASYDFYTAHPELFNEMYKEVMSELSQRQAEIQKK